MKIKQVWQFLNRDIGDLGKPGEIIESGAEVSKAGLELAIALIISIGDWKSRLHKPSLPAQTIEKSRVSEPAKAGFVCVAAVSTAQLRLVLTLE